MIKELIKVKIVMFGIFLTYYFMCREKPDYYYIAVTEMCDCMQPVFKVTSNKAALDSLNISDRILIERKLNLLARTCFEKTMKYDILLQDEQKLDEYMKNLCPDFYKDAIVGRKYLEMTDSLIQNEKK
jgi:hypothetical protein